MAGPLPDVQTQADLHHCPHQCPNIQQASGKFAPICVRILAGLRFSEPHLCPNSRQASKLVLGGPRRGRRNGDPRQVSKCGQVNEQIVEGQARDWVA
jgi:hypothetical protein